MLYLFFSKSSAYYFSSPIKGRKKIRSDYNSFKEEPITGRDDPSLVFITHPGSKQNFRALAKEFPIKLGSIRFAKEFELHLDL